MKIEKLREELEKVREEKERIVKLKEEIEVKYSAYIMAAAFGRA